MIPTSLFQVSITKLSHLLHRPQLQELLTRLTTHLPLQPLQFHHQHLDMSHSTYHLILSVITNSLTVLGSTHHRMPITHSLVCQSHPRIFEVFLRHLNLAKAYGTHHLTNQDITLPLIHLPGHLVLVCTVLKSPVVLQSQDQPEIVKDIRQMMLFRFSMRRG